MAAPDAPRAYSSPLAARGNPREIAAYIIRTIADDLPADMVCVCGYNAETGVFDEIAHYMPDGLAVNWQRVSAVLGECIASAPLAADPQYLGAADLAGTGFSSALLFPLQMAGQFLGILALFARRPQAFALDDAVRLAVPAKIVRAVLENFYLITQVITNLLANAIKYSPERSRIRVRARQATSAADLPESAPADITLPSVIVTVDDQGAGLTWEETRQVFMPFFRTQWARAGQAEGTGLGLTIARSIIELHRGRIWAEPATRERPGGHFLFVLPTA